MLDLCTSCLPLFFEVGELSQGGMGGNDVMYTVVSSSHWANVARCNSAADYQMLFNAYVPLMCVTPLEPSRVNLARPTGLAVEQELSISSFPTLGFCS